MYDVVDALSLDFRCAVNYARVREREREATSSWKVLLELHSVMFF